MTVRLVSLSLLILSILVTNPMPVTFVFDVKLNDNPVLLTTTVSGQNEPEQTFHVDEIEPVGPKNR